MKIATILGARPQFIKAAPVSIAMREAGIEEYIIHTGQHYDFEMSQVFFDELGLPAPNVNLGIGSGSHGLQTGRMQEQIERVLISQDPEKVLVYGDTNSTLAGALAAVKLHLPLAHVEAGLRSYNRTMPEEHNRVLTDHCADFLFCPTETAVKNLASEGILAGVFQVGDTMYDAVLMFREIAARRARILAEFGLAAGKFALATIHRPYNTDDPQKLKTILAALSAHDETVIFPVHPRTRAKIENLSDGVIRGNLKLVPPSGYLEMLMLIENARVVITDSGGVQKEAFFLKTPCLTLRPETEWVETLAGGWNRLVDVTNENILFHLAQSGPLEPIQMSPFGEGDAARQIVSYISRS